MTQKWTLNRFEMSNLQIQANENHRLEIFLGLITAKIEIFGTKFQIFFHPRAKFRTLTNIPNLLRNYKKL